LKAFDELLIVHIARPSPFNMIPQAFVLLEPELSIVSACNQSPDLCCDAAPGDDLIIISTVMCWQCRFSSSLTSTADMGLLLFPSLHFKYKLLLSFPLSPDTGSNHDTHDGMSLVYTGKLPVVLGVRVSVSAYGVPVSDVGSTAFSTTGWPPAAVSPLAPSFKWYHATVFADAVQTAINETIARTLFMLMNFFSLKGYGRSLYID
jgi:hypothetical protein